MRTCIDKTCEAVLCEECKDLKPSMCGDRGLDMPQDNCDVIRIEGADDVELNQGVCIDLREGVHAYDGDGTEISYTVEPSELGCCDVGEHEVKYTAVGKGNKMLPSFCMGKPMLTTADCGLMTKVVTRLVTILQALPPQILGIARTILPIGTTFDPMDGVSGVDDNGNETEVTFEGRYDLSTGKQSIASFESDIEQPAKSLKVALDPIQSLNGYDHPWVGGAGKNLLDSDYAIKFTLNKTITLPKTISANSRIHLHSDSYSYTTPPSSGLKYPYYVFRDADGNNCGAVWAYRDGWLTLSADAVVVQLWSNGYDYAASTGVEVTINGLTISLEEQSSWTPYSNICPISGRTSVDTIVSPTTSASDGATYTTALGRTVYGGTLDVVSGVLTVTHGFVDLGTLTWTRLTNANKTYFQTVNEVADMKKSSGNNIIQPIICSNYQTETWTHTLDSVGYDGCICEGWRERSYICIYDEAKAEMTANEFKIAMSGVQLCYELATPQTIQLSPQQVELLTGTNNVWSDGGEVEVIYSKPLEGATQLDIEGIYPITYHAHDVCGNETTETRYVFVTDDDISVEDTYAVACQGKTCYAFISCDEA